MFLASEFFFRPLWSKRWALSTRVERAESELRHIRALIERHRGNSALMAELEARLIRPGGDFSLFSFLEEAAGRAGIRENLVAMNPSQAIAENGYRRMEMLVRFENLTLEQLVRYLRELMGAPRLMRIGRLRVERSTRMPGRVKMTATVIAFEARGVGG